MPALTRLGFFGLIVFAGAGEVTCLVVSTGCCASESAMIYNRKNIFKTSYFFGKNTDFFLPHTAQTDKTYFWPFLATFVFSLPGTLAVVFLS